MPNLRREDIWEYHLGNKKKSKCLSCKFIKIKRNAKKGSKHEWESGHILPNGDGKMEIYENIRPICKECNIDDRKYVDSLEYMVAIGTLSQKKADKKRRKLKDLMHHIIEHGTKKCLHCNKSNVAPHSDYCRKKECLKISNEKILKI